MECGNADCSNSGLLVCARCKEAAYCSKECQRSQWKAHKIVCGKEPKDVGIIEKDINADELHKWLQAGVLPKEHNVATYKSDEVKVTVDGIRASYPASYQAFATLIAKRLMESYQGTSLLAATTRKALVEGAPVATLNEIVECSDAFTAAVPLMHSFFTVSHEHLCAVYEYIRLPPAFSALLTRFYEEFSYTVKPRLGNEYTCTSLKRGIKIGCPLSRVLCTLVLDPLFNNLESKFGSSDTTGFFLLPNMLVLRAPDPTRLQAMLMETALIMDDAGMDLPSAVVAHCAAPVEETLSFGTSIVDVVDKSSFFDSLEVGASTSPWGEFPSL